MKVGLVLEGGASRTVFSCGVMDALLENNIIADYVIGTSAGIAYGTSYASMQIGRNRDVAVNFMHDKRYMGMKHLINRKNRSYYNLDFVFSDIPNKEVPFDFETFGKFNGDVIATVTNIETGKAEYMTVPAQDRDFYILRASCALPVMFKPIEINGKKYLDGGICDPVPYNKAVMEGCDKIIVILTREKGYLKSAGKSEKLAGFLYKKYPEFLKALKKRPVLYNETINKIEEDEKIGKAFIFRPEKIDGVKRTEKDPKILQSLYDQGRELGNRRMGEVAEFLGRK